MRFIECKQGTKEWDIARCGLVTASMFAVAISTVGGLNEQQQKYADAIKAGATKAGAMTIAGYKAEPSSETLKRYLRGESILTPSDLAEEYAARVSFEIISGEPQGQPMKVWVMERGHEMEGTARMRYESRTKRFVTEAGICVDEHGHGYSTDGLVDQDGLIEIKCPVDCRKVMQMWATGDTSEYDHQIQGGLWLTGRAWLDFIMFAPALTSVGKDLYVKRIYRDDKFIDDMVIGLARFRKIVDANLIILRKPLELAA